MFYAMILFCILVYAYCEYHRPQIEAWVETKLSNRINKKIETTLNKYHIPIHAHTNNKDKSEYVTQKDGNIYCIWYYKETIQWPNPHIIFQVKNDGGFKIRILKADDQLDRYVAAIKSNQISNLPLVSIVDIKK